MERGGEEVWEDEDTTQRATGSPENVMDSAQHKHPALSLSTEQLRTTAFIVHDARVCSIYKLHIHRESALTVLILLRA